MRKIFIALAVAAILAPSAVFAHQPRISGNQTLITVDNPEVSKAYYGYLSLNPVNFYIDAPAPFDLYVGLLVPDLPDIRKDLSAKIYQNDRLIRELRPSEAEWGIFWEPYGGDNYFQGPEYRVRAVAGKYRVEVFRPAINNEKYVVAIGEKENFTPAEAVQTFVNMPKLKTFFGKSPWTAYFNRVGLYAGGLLLGVIAAVWIVVIIIRLIIKLFKKLFKRDKQKIL